MKMTVLFLATIILSATALAGCDAKTSSTDTASNAPSTSSPTPPAATPPADAPQTDAPKADAPKTENAPAATGKQPLEKTHIAVIETNLGTIKIKLRPDVAPETVKNFISLATKKFYDGTKFHRVIPGFMIQGGDPKSKGDDRTVMGTGDPGYKIKAEFNDLSHKRGVISMARSSDPDSAGSQFFIVVKDSTFLDHQYTAFGEVIEGMDVADKIVNLKRDGRDNPLPENPAIVKHIKIEEK